MMGKKVIRRPVAIGAFNNNKQFTIGAPYSGKVSTIGTMQ